MSSLWTAEPTTETHTAPPPPAAPPSPPAGGGGSRWPAALGGGAVSAIVVAGVLLGTGAVDRDQTPAPATAAPVVTAASDGKADIVRSVYAAASPSVVSVRTDSGSGTGFLVDSDGTIVTNAHVVGQSQQVQVRFQDGGESHTADVLGVDASTDLAALKVDPSAADGVRPLVLADSNRVQVGDTAVAIGYPLGLDRTATAGIVSGLGREIQAPNGFSIDEVIQTDAPINPGNSGGPLLNARGQVIGINSQIATAGGSEGNLGIGFAVPADTIRKVFPQLERGVAPKHAFLGLSTAPASGGGAQVGAVTGDGPAARAGLQAGDVVVEVDGKAVQTPDDVAGAIEDRSPGDRVEVKVRRGGAERSVQVTLGQRPDSMP